MGFALATHYCGGLAVESQIVMGNTVLDCGMADMYKGCKSDSPLAIHIKKMPCCENQYQSLDIDDDYKRTIFQSNVNIDFIASFIVSFFQVSLFSENKENQYANYLPPLLECDVTVLHQVFLI
jgi:hypothetical protein